MFMVFFVFGVCWFSVCFVSFGCDAGEFGLPQADNRALSSNVPIRRVFCFIFCFVGGGGRTVQVRPARLAGFWLGSLGNGMFRFQSGSGFGIGRIPASSFRLLPDSGALLTEALPLFDETKVEGVLL